MEERRNWEHEQVFAQWKDYFIWEQAPAPLHDPVKKEEDAPNKIFQS